MKPAPKDEGRRMSKCRRRGIPIGNDLRPTEVSDRGVVSDSEPPSLVMSWCDAAYFNR